MQRHMKFTVVILIPIAIIVTLIGIWTQDERWAQTALLFWLVALIPGAATFFSSGWTATSIDRRL